MFILHGFPTRRFGGELLARSLEGTLALDVVERVISNGSIYMDLVQLSRGQLALLALPAAAAHHPLHRGAQAARGALDGRDRAPSVAIVWSAEDPIARVAMAHRLAAARPDASLCILDGVGHFPMVEDPERFGAAACRALGLAER